MNVFNNKQHTCIWWDMVENINGTTDIETALYHHASDYRRLVSNTAQTNRVDAFKVWSRGAIYDVVSFVFVFFVFKYYAFSWFKHPDMDIFGYNKAKIIVFQTNQCLN